MRLNPLILLAFSLIAGSAASLAAGIHPKVDRLVGQHAQTMGPNCFNYALIQAGLLETVRYADSQEFKFFLKSPHCRELQDHEAREPGDIGAIRLLGLDDWVEYHGFIFKDENTVYTKNGVNKEEGYKIATLDSVLELYKVPAREECRRNVGNYSAKCVIALTVHRCRPDLSLATDELGARLMRVENKLQQMEVAMESAIFSPAPIREDVKVSFSATLRMIREEVIPNLQRTPTVSQSSRHWAEKVRNQLYGISEQLKTLKEGEAHADAANTEADLWDALAELH